MPDGRAGGTRLGGLRTSLRDTHPLDLGRRPAEGRPHPLLDTLLRLALIALCLVSLGSYARSREPIRRDAGVMLGALAAVAALWMVHHGATWRSAPLARKFGDFLLLAQPALLLRLVAHFQRVPSSLAAAAGAGAAVAAGAEFAPGGLLATSMGVGIMAWFVFLQGYCVIAFTGSARRKGGAARRQLNAVAVGAALLGITVLTALITIATPKPPVPGAATAMRVVVEVMLLMVGCCYFCGFTPPAWLRQRWQMPDVYGFLTRAITQFQSVDDTLRSLAGAGLQVTGARAAAIALPRPDGPALALRWWAAEAAAPSTEVLTDPVDGPLARAWIDGKPAAARIRGELAPVTARLAEKVGAQSVIGVPIGGSSAAPERLGLLALFTDRGWLFPDAEIALLHLMASHAAVVLTNQRLLADAKAAAERLQRTNAELDHANRAKDEFLATLAHELRNPLSPVRTGIGLLRARRGDPPAFERTVDMVEQQVAHMVHLIDDLMDISRITRNKLKLRCMRVDLAQIVREAVEIGRPSCERAGQRLTVEPSPHPLWLQADPVRLAQVVGNLLSNASKYTQRGGSISVTVVSQTGHAVLSVGDNGRGIPGVMLTRIFEPFVQGDRTEGGLGIGLTLVRRLVELHGGTVEAASPGPGAGSVFTVRLPAPAQFPDTGQVAAAVEALGRGGGRRILVVDDNRSAAESLAELLALQGYAVRTAFDGLEALRTGEAFRPEAVLMDMSMPRLDGYGAATQMRQRAWGRDAVLVALTGWGQEQDRRRAQEAGFDRHVTKPVANRDLLALLATLWP